jgi:hypothetical protein
VADENDKYRLNVASYSGKFRLPRQWNIPISSI